MKTPCLAAALATLLAVPSAARPAGAAERSIVVDLRAATYAGAFDGYGVRRESGGLATFEASARPELRGEAWRLEVPLRFAHRQTLGADLVETSGGAGVEPWWHASERLRLGLEADVFGANRPSWPDLYQRDPVTGALPPTDRYSFLAWRGGVQAYAHPVAHQHVRARYRFASYDYKDDPAFSELDVMHITPRDRTQHEVDLSWRYVEKAWAFALRLDYAHRAYRTLLSRAARTGSTNGDTTPKQELDDVEPSAEVELLRALEGRARLSLRYGLEVRRDPFEGYYSYTGHHPRVQARFAATDRLEAGVSYEGWYRTYGPNGSTRLEAGSGDRRTDSRTKLAGELEYRLRGGFAMRGEVAWVTRGTNYRDYVPPPDGVSAFDVRFDYTNVSVLAGLAYRL